ncbi:hypothetical protein RESH_00350 [Rhodopirellula europaea SH398]|uniref:Uncharacterized protein n=1 Tax=Rhodopirellula europaea SH398 TaxID=1263868 RepID=M5SC52_9BACT|nr:hypothetical protein RESH_00350 [Rhodopirellula europaea SH398]
MWEPAEDVLKLAPSTFIDAPTSVPKFSLNWGMATEPPAVTLMTSDASNSRRSNISGFK